MAEDQFYISVGRDPRSDMYLALITLGHEKKGDTNITVCDVKRVATVKEGQEWGRQQLADPEWHTKARKCNI